MLGGLLVFVGEGIQEISSSLGKQLLSRRELSYAFYGTLNYFLVAVFFLAVAFIGGQSLVFNSAAAGFFAARFFVEIAQAEVSLRALATADRTTFGFVRVLTIPLLLLVDLALGYPLSFLELSGIALVIVALSLYFLHEHTPRTGVGLTLFTAVNAVVGISLYKYNITHFHSVAFEQFYICVLISLYFLFRTKAHERSAFVQLLLQPKVIPQLFAHAAASVLVSFAYLYGAASLILALTRASTVFWSAVAGMLYFQEKKTVRKGICCAGLVLGVLIMAL